MIFLGVDQTGAVDSRGRPKPLPACLINGQKIEVLYLKSFSDEIKKYQPDIICIDCVLGLPTTTKISLRQAISRAGHVSGFGRKSAQDFFETIASGKKHVRYVEKTLGANSVFTVHPFQKNIQTGTFRFWKEIAQTSNWFYFPALPHEKKNSKNKIPVVEGYPSYYWKKLLQQKYRAPEQILNILKTYFPELKIKKDQAKLLLKDANLADALVLALAARQFKTDLKRRSHPEGWILGFKSKLPKPT